MFKAKLHNIGAGATPPNTVTGVSFYVDGQFTSWSTTDGTPLQPGETRLIEANGGPRGTNVWTATAGAHVIRGQVDDINRVSGESNEWNNEGDRTLLVDVNNKGLLLGSTSVAPSQVNLTAEGSEDWIHWGLENNDSITRKANGGNQFGALTKVGEGFRSQTGGFGLSARWSDGAPTQKVDDTHASLWWNGPGHGYSFTAPADATERILKVYVGGIEGARGKLVAKLSDGSAPEYSSTTWNGNLGNGNWAPIPGSFTAVYTLRYKAASPDQKLSVTWLLEDEPNRFLGQARMQAATLSKVK